MKTISSQKKTLSNVAEGTVAGSPLKDWQALLEKDVPVKKKNPHAQKNVARLPVEQMKNLKAAFEFEESGLAALAFLEKEIRKISVDDCRQLLEWAFGGQEIVALEAVKLIPGMHEEERAGLWKKALGSGQVPVVLEAVKLIPRVPGGERAGLVKIALGSRWWFVACDAVKLIPIVPEEDRLGLVRAALGSEHYEVAVEAVKLIPMMPKGERVGLVEAAFGSGQVPVVLEAVKLIQRVPEREG